MLGRMNQRGVSSPRPAGGRSSAITEAWSQRVGGLAEIPGLLREFGVDSAGVLTGSGLDPGALDHIENRIPYTAAVRLLHQCRQKTGCAHFGLLVGQRWHLSHFGPLGELMKNSHTVGDALRTLAVRQHLNSDAGVAFLLTHADTMSLGYAIYRKDVQHPQHVYDVAVGLIRNILRELCGAQWQASEVVFSHAHPADDIPYRHYFQAPLRFDYEYSAVRFSADWAEHTIPGADPERRRALTAEIEAGDGVQLISQLHRSLRLLLLSGKSSGDDLAQMLYLQRRTLNRRLQAQGTTFQKVLDEVRFAVARQLLEHTRIPIDDIAAALCYSELSAFMHAFRRWTATTPAQWRKSAVGASLDK
jgi:AraC-like DNA-binding protein